MKGKVKFVSTIVLTLWWLTSLAEFGQGLGVGAKAASIPQPMASFQDDEWSQLQAAGNPKPADEIEDTTVFRVEGVTGAAQSQQLQNGVPVSGIAPPASTPGQRTWDLVRNQFFITVPNGATHLRFTLSGSPSSADVDLAVRLNQPVELQKGQLIRDYISESPGSFEEILINSPSPGNWFVAVGNNELFSVSFTLVASFGTCSSTLQIDDGSFEDAVGYANEGASSAYFVNRITPSNYPATLTSVLIYFRSGRGSLPPGFPISILVGTNPSGSSNIDGIFLRQSPSVIRFTGSFNEYPVEPVTIFSGDFVIGFVVANPRDVYPAAVDTTFPRGRSYATTDGFDFHRLEEFRNIQSGNFGIRARVQGCPGRLVIFPSFIPQGVSGFVPAGGMVEYEFDPMSGARYRFSTCDGFANFDTVIEVFQNGRLVARDDDSCASRRSTVEVTMFDSARAIVRVRGYSSSSTGTFTMVYSRIR